MLQKHPKTGVYYFRKRIPQDMVTYFGKAEFKRSLDTKNPSEANARIPEIEVIFNKHIADARKNALVPFDERQKALIELKELGLIAQDAEDITLEAITRARQKLAKLCAIFQKAHDEKVAQGKLSNLNFGSEYGDNDFNSLGGLFLKNDRFTELLDTKLALFERMYLEPGFKASSYISADGMRILIPESQAEQEKLESIITVAPVMPLHSHRKNAHIEQPTLAPGFPTVSQVLKEWIKVRNPAQNSIQEWSFAARWFKDLHDDMPVNYITRAHMNEYRDTLMEIPIHLPKHLQRLPLKELVAMKNQGKLSELGEARSRATVNKLMVAMQSLLKISLEPAGLVNPAKGLQLKLKDRQNERFAYSGKDLQQIFHSPLYTGSISSASRHLPGKVIERDGKFWLPLLALFTGARLEEIAQALVEDIIEQQGVWCLSINILHGNKTLKTESSQRIVPIHAELRRCGFLGYVNTLKTSGEKRLFPDLKKGSKQRYGSLFSQWYGRYCEKIGADTNKKSFHSFRHSFKDACREHDIPEEMQDCLMGHSSGKVGRRYGGGYNAEKRNTYIQRISYPGLDLAHLHSRPRARGLMENAEAVAEG